jgi:hypothetical protein
LVRHSRHSGQCFEVEPPYRHENRNWRRIQCPFRPPITPSVCLGRNTCQAWHASEDLMRMVGTRKRCNYWAISKVSVSAGRCSDHKKSVSPLLHRLRQYFALPHRRPFRAERKGHPVLETAGMWPRRTLQPIPARCRLGKHFQKTSMVDVVEHSPTQPVLRANSTRCFVRWQTIGPVQQGVVPSGFSPRKKSIESCAKG